MFADIGHRVMTGEGEAVLVAVSGCGSRVCLRRDDVFTWEPAEVVKRVLGEAPKPSAYERVRDDILSMCSEMYARIAKHPEPRRLMWTRERMRAAVEGLRP